MWGFFTPHTNRHTAQRAQERRNTPRIPREQHPQDDTSGLSHQEGYDNIA